MRTLNDLHTHILYELVAGRQAVVLEWGIGEAKQSKLIKQYNHSAFNFIGLLKANLWR